MLSDTPAWAENGVKDDSSLFQIELRKPKSSDMLQNVVLTDAINNPMNFTNFPLLYFNPREKMNMSLNISELLQCSALRNLTKSFIRDSRVFPIKD